MTLFSASAARSARSRIAFSVSPSNSAKPHVHICRTVAWRMDTSMGERKIKTRSKILAYQRELCCKKQGMTFRVSSKQDHRQLGRGHSCTPYFG